MSKESVLVLGLGEIGRTLFDLLEEERSFSVYGLDLDEEKMRAAGQERNKLPDEVDTMHICLPCKVQNTFVDSVMVYANQFKPKLLIINSTVPPGTTKEVQRNCKCLVAHSPIRGVHKSPEHMKWEMRRWTKYVGGANQEASKAARKHFEKMHLKVKTLRSCAETELAKLFETTYRAWMIACFQEMHRIALKFDTDFDDVVDFLEDTHRIRFDRPIMFPGFVGGHCLVENTQLLLESYDSEFLKLILQSNKRVKDEMKDPRTREESEKVRKRVEKLQDDMDRCAECASGEERKSADNALSVC